MAKNSAEQTILIDGNKYPMVNISEQGKALIQNIQFVDEQIQQLKNEWAIADTARIGYSNALKGELKKKRY